MPASSAASTSRTPWPTTFTPRDASATSFTPQGTAGSAELLELLELLDGNGIETGVRQVLSAVVAVLGRADPGGDPAMLRASVTRLRLGMAHHRSLEAKGKSEQTKGGLKQAGQNIKGVFKR
ncbi:hypothetical protein GCM10012285_27610 [Streptomyces kronopolitis]|uniref:Uncharacterized protein n=1 Tax=Streptomyces kronopolitis TaxID=1612435 RepID=A0ABQ2JFI6_9ACTN|nr:hypothetical protein [Streptomyces kronopolitis]GGN44750.1 hypothetical protein GCM10012285_27610 [Streptomyces kronopolitis]